jgi:hypothetical protein
MKLKLNFVCFVILLRNRPSCNLCHVNDNAMIRITEFYRLYVDHICVPCISN